MFNRTTGSLFGISPRPTFQTTTILNTHHESLRLPGSRRRRGQWPPVKFFAAANTG
jgi:hypothetical protein